MNEKYLLKIIQHGKTQQAVTVQNGVGIVGKAVVIQATDVARYQLVNAVTLLSPTKLQLKRVGDALHIAMPGSDIDAPDVVINDYFSVSGSTLQGASSSGEWMIYDTTSLKATTAQQAIDAEKTTAVTLGGDSVFTSFAEHSWIWLGGLVGLAASSHGGGASNAAASTTTDTSPLSVIQAYAADGATTAPTAAQYASMGVVLPTVSGLTSASVLNAMNSVVALKTKNEVGTSEQLQKLSDNLNSSYIKILAEANGSVADATIGIDPSAQDYANLGITIGTTTQTLALMNSVLGEKSTTEIDTIAELKAIGIASDDLMKVAAGITGATLTNTDLLALGLKINGNNSGITTAIATAFQTNLANLKDSLGLTDTLASGAAVNSASKVQALFSLQAMRSFNDDGLAISNKTQPAPGISDYKNIGIKSYASLSKTSNASRIDLADSSFSTDSNFSLQSTLNSALDRLPAGTALTKVAIQDMVDAYYRILKQADGNTSTITDVYTDADNDPAGAGSVALASDYANVGLTKVDGSSLNIGNATNTKILSLLNDAVGRMDVTKVDTVTELSALEKAAENVFAISTASSYGSISYVGASADADWVAGLTALGITGVSANNISAIRAALDTKDALNNGNTVDTVDKLQAIVSATRLNAFNNEVASIGGVKNAATPTLADWGALVSVNTNLSDATKVSLDTAPYWKTTNPFNGLNALNSALDTYNTVTTVSDDTLKSIAEAYGRVLQEADASRTYNTDVSKVNGGTADLVVSDLTTLGVNFLNSTGGITPLTSEQNLLLNAIGSLASTAVDTVSELNDLAKVADNVIKQATNGVVTYQDSEWVSALTSLGITGVNATNISTIKVKISATANDGTEVDSINELQSLVSMVRINDYATLHTGYTLPSIEDYQTLVAQYGEFADHTKYSSSLILSESATGGTAGVGGGASLAYSNANSTYLNAYNEAVNARQSNSFTPIEIKNMVLAYNSILSEANGSSALDQTTYDPLGADYIAVGVGNPNDSAINTKITNMLSGSDATSGDTGSAYATLLTDSVANKTVSQVSTIAQLNTLAGIILKVQELEQITTSTSGGTTGTAAAAYTSNIDGGILSAADLTTLGLDTSGLTDTSLSSQVRSKRLYDVIDHIIAIDHTSAVSRSTLDSLAEMQALISNATSTING